MYADASLQTRFGRDLDFEAGSLIGLTPAGMLRVVASHSLDKQHGDSHIVKEDGRKDWCRRKKRRDEMA